jgi:hypothetical protein
MATTPVSGQISPDGMWRWDGQRWVLTGAMPPPRAPAPAAAMAPEHPAEATTAPARSALAMAGAIVAMFGAPLVLVACIVPYVYLSEGGSSSIFNPGYDGGAWFAIEPLTTVLAILAAGVLVLVMRSKIARALGGGLLVALGLQALTLFVGYTFGALGSGTIAPAGPIGALGGLITFFGGGLVAGSLFSRAD